jgi:hypothetical protein
MANLATATIRLDFSFTLLGRAAMWACNRLAARLERGGGQLAGAAGRALVFAVLRAPPRFLFRIRPIRTA